jgi:hypothetical protein
MKKYSSVLILSAFLLAACNSSQPAAPQAGPAPQNGPVSVAEPATTAPATLDQKGEEQIIEQTGKPMSDRSMVSFKVGEEEIKISAVVEATFLADSANYGEEGETTIIFGGNDDQTSSLGYTLGLSFPGTKPGQFIAEKGRLPFLDPLMNYGVTDAEAGTNISYASTTLTTGDELNISITRFDHEAIEGTFSGLLSEINPTGYNLRNKVQISEGNFVLDLTKHELQQL